MRKTICINNLESNISREKLLKICIHGTKVGNRSLVTFRPYPHTDTEGTFSYLHGNFTISSYWGTALAIIFEYKFEPRSLWYLNFDIVLENRRPKCELANETETSIREHMQKLNVTQNGAEFVQC